MNTKEEFLKIYDTIVYSNDYNKMHTLGDVTKKMMTKFIEVYPQQAKEYVDILQSVNWDNYITAKEAEEILSKMEPKPAWSKPVWENLLSKLQLTDEHFPCYNKCALYIAMCMVDSDSGHTIAYITKQPYEVIKNTDEYFTYVYKLAVDKLTDKDGVFNIRKYFNL